MQSSLRTWKPLPNLPESRSWHGCDGVFIGNTRYLILYGGNNMAGSVFQHSNNDIIFLNMDSLNSKWVSRKGIQLDGSYRVISGGIVRRLTTSQCDMMFIEPANYLHVCSGNYTWTKTAISPRVADFMIQYVAVGVNNFLPCFKWFVHISLLKWVEWQLACISIEYKHMIRCLDHKTSLICNNLMNF